MSKKVHCIIGDDVGGNNCTQCAFNLTCPDHLGLPSCAQNGKVCTEQNVERLNPKYQTYSIDGDLQCKFSTYSADGDLICNAIK